MSMITRWHWENSTFCAYIVARVHARIIARAVTTPHQMGEPMCDDEAEEIIGYVDKNGDGKIDIDEFIVMMLKCIADEEELDQEED